MPRYVPPIQRPPEGPLNKRGLKERVEYGNIFKKNRNISPRLMQFVEKFQNNCKKLLGAKKMKRQEQAALERDIQIDEGMLQSRWDETHGPQGLCTILVEDIQNIVEQHIYLHYGDYLAASLRELRQHEAMPHPGFSWSDVQHEIDKEQQPDWMVFVGGKRREQPWLDAVKAAAIKLDVDHGLLLYEIEEYAERNNRCHRGIKGFIDAASWVQLAEHLYWDRQALAMLEKQVPEKHAALQHCMERLKEQFFDAIYFEDGRVQYFESIEARQRSARKIQRLKEKEEQQRTS
ncbi:hypothetical protein L228DRAFT_248821 [Xylona heveae TC161]|uniref:Uncharacterized protein n=1 Tax=Xylona heveae (strain CBS 132557 / TC161) TaxID=1328760 RepID=A0A165FJS9_XYLHT|nr:hypothetical protein L228DRAFT_248821 [Xylona heveae TC161]KZF21059.1 hypothetical protein L228DRAFT_248821 [Xylona heveae TC161]